MQNAVTKCVVKFKMKSLKMGVVQASEPEERGEEVGKGPLPLKCIIISASYAPFCVN